MGWFGKSDSGSKDVFAARIKQQQIWQLMRRVIGFDVDNNSTFVGGQPRASLRTWERSKRFFPVACVPVSGDAMDPDFHRISCGATRDLSETGVGLITHKPPVNGPVCCGFWLHDLMLLEGRVLRAERFCGDLCEVGIEIVGVIESPATLQVYREHLQPCLVPGDHCLA